MKGHQDTFQSWWLFLYRVQGSAMNAQKENLEKLSAPLKELQARDYLSVEEAATLLGVSRWTIQRAIKRGRLQTLKVLGRRIIPQKSFNQFLNNQYNESHATQTSQVQW